MIHQHTTNGNPDCRQPIQKKCIFSLKSKDLQSNTGFRRYTLPLILILFLIPVFFTAADPFTSGSKGESLPAASRGSLIHIPSFLVDSQLIFREKAGEILATLKDNPKTSAMLWFLFIVFIYGFLHGAGPGHRKTVVFSLFLSRKAKPWEPFAAGFLSAELHAGTSLILILIFKVVKQTVASFTSSERLAFYLEGWTFIALGFFSLVLILVKIIEMQRNTAKTELALPHKNIYALLFISSLFPCPGATMILLFALSEGLLTIGILGVVAMSVGMGTIISLVGYLAMTGREGLFRWFKNREDKVKSISDKLELTSYVFVILFALWMGSPFIYWLLTHTGTS